MKDNSEAIQHVFDEWSIVYATSSLYHVVRSPNSSFHFRYCLNVSSGTLRRIRFRDSRKSDNIIPRTLIEQWKNYNESIWIKSKPKTTVTILLFSQEINEFESNFNGTYRMLVQDVQVGGVAPNFNQRSCNWTK